MTWDLLIRGARVFDGQAELPCTEDVAVHEGRVVARGPSLSGEAARTVEAAGAWLMPGLVDIHTHYDLEVELAPSMVESLRHGVTTVVMSNCSLGLAYGHQRHTGHDPVVSCFARVENLPKGVLRAAADEATWTTSAGYLDHLRTQPIALNVVPMIPHSMLRIEAMGLPAAIRRDPTPDELQRMTALVESGMREGYAGLSTDALPFHYLAEDPHRAVKIPTQHAGFGELRALTDVLRAHGRVWQTTPPKDNPLQSLRNFLLSSGRLFGRPLTVTAVAAMAIVPNRSLLPMARVISSLLHSRLLNGRFWLQALPARFKVWADGAITPLAEEVEPLRELNAPDLEDVEARRALLRDPAWRGRFRAWWTAGKGWPGLAWLTRVLRLERTQLTRDLNDMVVDRGGPEVWRGEPLSAVHLRLVQWQAGEAPARDAEEQAAFEAAPRPVGEDVDFLVWLFDHFDTALSWWTITANASEAEVADILFDERFLPGFSDAGAHLSNMAFYDANLRALQHARRRGERGVARMVHRLTAKPAGIFGVQAGTMAVGDVADLVLVDPAALAAYDSEGAVQRVTRPELGHEQLVNRSDGVVRMVVVGGEVAFEHDALTPVVGTRALGRVLTA